jgi:chromate reductase
MAGIHILGISGSLRAKSLNTAALRAAKEMLPEGVTMDIADLSAIPMYNDDILQQQGFPPSVVALREQIKSADALMLAMPEYNYSLPAVLKNAIDWASRPPEHPLNEKPVAILGASAGFYGTARSQYHLRQVCVFTNMHPLNKPEIMITQAQNKFDAEGKLVDQATRDLLGQMVLSLVAWTRRLGPK